MTFKILGITDAVHTCDCCGKKNLKKAVELETPDGETVHYGTDCAGAALYGRKDRKNGQAAEFRAKIVAKCRSVLPAVALFSTGLPLASSTGAAARSASRRTG